MTNNLLIFREVIYLAPDKNILNLVYQLVKFKKLVQILP